MRWIKQGVVFAPDRNFPWMVSHAQVPVVDGIGPDVLRIYFAAKDGEGHARLAYLEVDADEPRNVLYVHDRPVLPLGERGSFDDSGIMPSWLVNHEGRKYLYYIGWSRQVSVPYHLALGLAVSTDGGRTFEKLSAGPVCDRAVDEPYFATSGCVRREGDRWRLWYTSCTGWELVDDRPEPRYYVRHAESSDGIDWRRSPGPCIGYADGEAIGRPCVYHQDGVYRMLYSYRGLRRYREDRAQSYRLGYAESADGLTWVRRDGEVGIHRSESGWDSEMIEYAYVHDQGTRTYLFYNGNGFGKTGIGYAVLEPYRATP